MNLSENLKRLRKDKNLSQEQLAEELSVSRQSVSKWESGLVYPEMDKVLQLCEMFNLNIDELLNQDIREVSNKREAKNNINKFIEDLLNSITKTVNMFMSLTFKSKLKLIFEQIFLVFMLFILFYIVGVIGYYVFKSVTLLLPTKVYWILFEFFRSLYYLVALILSIIILFNIFKIRYLNYYEDKKPEKLDSNKTEKKEFIKDEKIIIRDPNNSEYSFFSGLLKLSLFILKIFAVMFSIFLIFTFILLVILLVISIAFINTGLLLFGLLLSILSALIINYIFLHIIYNFIVTRKYKKEKLALLFILSLIILGLGIGMISISATEFKLLDEIEGKYAKEKTYTYQMDKDSIILGNKINYIESDNKDLKIIFTYMDNSKLNFEKSGNKLSMFVIKEREFLFQDFKMYLESINNKHVINYYNYKIDIYTTKENINILKANSDKYYQEGENNENIITEYKRKIYNLEEELNEKEERITELESKLEERN